MKNAKKNKGKRIMLVIIAIIALAALGLGGYALYGSAQMKKIPGLTAKQALDYLLDGCPDGVVTVGVYQNGEATYTVYGADGKTLVPTPHTYEIGSLTKTFTAAMVCNAVREGRLALDAPIDTYLELPAKAHYPTVGQLVTHTSGYKGYYMESPMIANHLKGRNDFYGVGDSMVLGRLAKTDITDAEHGFVYSNFGYAALGLILEKVYQTEYTTLANNFVRGELGLANTRISDGRGDLGKYWDWLAGDTYMAAGALTSNVEDMLQYAKLLLKGAVCDGDCLGALRRINATTPQYELLGFRMDEIAYGWMIDDERGVIWHNGGTSDYNSYLGLDMQNQRAVIVLSNLAPSYRIPATVIGSKLLMEARTGDD